MLAMINPTMTSPLSCKLQTGPFFLDSGATVHISPDVADFIMLKPIHEQPIQGVGGSCIAVTGLGTIQLQSDQQNHLDLKNILHIPKSTICLLSVSKLAQQNGVVSTFDNTKVTLYSKTGSEVIATGTLLPKHGLYALNIHNHQALAVHALPNLKTWQLRLGHANY